MGTVRAPGDVSVPGSVQDQSMVKIRKAWPLVCTRYTRGCGKEAGQAWEVSWTGFQSGKLQ